MENYNVSVEPSSYDVISSSYPFRSPYNSKNIPKDYEINAAPSMTIPDQSMTVRELLKRHAQGLPLGGSRVPSYDSDDNGDINNPFAGINWESLDISEKHQLVTQHQDHIKQMEKELRDAVVKGDRLKQTQLELQIQPPSTPKEVPVKGTDDQQKP